MADRTPWNALQAVLRSDPATPRITFYERTPGPTNGERIELSGKVLVNWVSKAANLLSEESDVSPGSRVGVHLPTAHWRTTYWCLAAWALGATVVFVDSDASMGSAEASDAKAGSAPVGSLSDVDLLVTDVPDDSFGGDQVVVSLPMLARAAAVDLPGGAIDEARELSTFGDVFSPVAAPALSDEAFVADSATLRFSDLVAASPQSAGRLYLTIPSPVGLMRALAAKTGSVVMVRGMITDDDLARILTQESATEG